MANGYVRYGNSIHLDGFQILDFCIENAISLESLSDLNLGRKVFLTGNDTNAGYLRENVWDGTRWRTAAYLDDIDKINEKLDLIFGDELDTDTIIDSWKEVQDFLSGIEDTKTLMTMLDDKLSKSEGGTIESPIVVNSEYNYAITNNARGNWTGIRYRIADTTKGYLGINEEEKPIHIDAKQSQINFLLHSGNVGDYTAGAANRLANKVSLWGNEFDGTQSLSGSLILDNNKQLRIKDSVGTACAVIGLGSDNNLLIGGDLTSGGREYKMYLDGYNIYFRTGAKQTAMTINSSGNVTVGNADYAGEDYKFRVQGSGYFNSDLYVVNWAYLRSFDTLGKVHTLIGLNNKNQVLINDGADVPTIIRGGNVGIGVLDPKYKLDVAGIGNFSSRVLIGGVADDGESALQVNKTMSIGASKTDFGLRFNRNAIYAWIPENYGHSHRVSFGLKHGDTTIGELGLYRDSSSTYYAFIGSHTSPWFSINSTESFFNVATTFNGGALIPSGQKLTIGDATIEYDSNAKAIKVDGNLFTTGTNASGGKADAQQGGTGGNAEVYKYDLDWGEQVYEIQNVKGDVNVNVQVYEWNENGNSWDMILTDVSVTANIITVTFGRPTSVDHMVTVV